MVPPDVRDANQRSSADFGVAESARSEPEADSKVARVYSVCAEREERFTLCFVLFQKPSRVISDFLPSPGRYISPGVCLSVCLSVCPQDNSKTTAPILMKLCT